MSVTNFFIRENKNDLFPEDLLYPIKYTGPEKDEKKVKEKIIACVLKCSKNKTKKDSEFGELAIFEVEHSETMRSEPARRNEPDRESVTYVVSRKPFYSSLLSTKPVVCLKKKCFSKEEDLQSTVELFSTSPVFKELFSSTNYIEYIFDSGFTDTPEFDILYRFLNGEDDPESEKYLKIKNVCHSLYSFFKETQPGIKNLLENILTDDDYRNI